MRGENKKDVPTVPMAMPPIRGAQPAEVLKPMQVDDRQEPQPDASGRAPDDTGADAIQRVDSESNAIAATTLQLGKTLIDADLTIAIAESLTGGALAAEIVRVPGISAVFQGGIVAYQFAAKRELLGVDRDLLAANGAVHPEVAQQMARGVRHAFDVEGERTTDIGVSTTGVAGPDAADGRTPGTVYVGIDSLFGQRTVELDFSNLVRADDPVGTRQRVRTATVEAAIYNVLEHLAEQDDREAQ